VDVSGKVYIVTGSNCGIGLETARQLVEMGGTVILACRYVHIYNTIIINNIIVVLMDM
jgi:NAD(P)-dependent dehydrogenase (short-subunit alcohol dehydrogenase family)